MQKTEKVKKKEKWGNKGKEWERRSTQYDNNTFLRIYKMQLFVYYYSKLDFPGGSDGREFLQNAGDLSSIPGPGRSPGERNGYLLQYSCLDNPIDRRAWWATVPGVTKKRHN